MNDYEARQEARRERYLDRATAAEREAEARLNSQANRTLVAMGGEPIKIGHHSERRHRKLFERAHADMNKGCEAMDKAKHYREKAAGVGKGGISSDDPDALTKLRNKVAALEKKQEVMKAANQIIRRKPKNEPTPEKIAALRTMFREHGCTKLLNRAEELFRPDFCGRIGFPAYALQNNNANIQRIRERIATLKDAPDENTEREAHGCRIIENADENRIQLVFPGKPVEGIRAILKSEGFRWSRTNGAWQRHLNSAGRGAVERALQRIASL
ncbi:MAG: DUF3560 domain-containing protein [Planctomycetota bacterium]|jgi:hypothetical protein